MPIRNQKSELIDSLLKFMVFSSLTLTVLLAPNAVQALDKPLQKYLRRLDKKQRERELRKTLVYMQRQGLVRGHYDHGLKITDKARKRLDKLELDTLEIPKPRKWDHKWRVIFYDIPEYKKQERNALSFRLRRLGCQQLQKSVWIHPFPCQEPIEVIASAYAIESYITYLETAHINNESQLVKRFNHLKMT